MMFRLTLLSALFAATAATTAATVTATELTAAEIPAETEAGAKLLSKSRRANDNNNNYYEDTTWMTKHSLKFDSCHTIHAYGGGEDGGNDQEGGNGTPFSTQHLVSYKLCPTEKGCGYCAGGAEYVVELRDFVENYIEAKEEMQEAACETVKENCYCNNNYYDDNTCYAKCYATAGLDYCDDGNDGNGNNFDVAEYMECREAEFGNYYNLFYIGPVCSKNGKSIHLKLFSDASCTTEAKSGSYEQYNYGKSLPYSKKSIVEKNDCVSCKQQDNNNNNNNNNNGNYYEYEAPEVLEVCENLYETAAKCEKGLKYKNANYRNTKSCHYINNVIPALEKVYHRNGGAAVASVFAALFFITTILAGASAYYFHSKVSRAAVDLSARDGSAYA